MKKSMLLAALALGGALMAGHASAETAGNVIGYTKVTLPAQGELVLLSVPVKSTGGGSAKLSDLFGANTLTAGFNPVMADVVYIYTSGTYQGYFKNSSDGQFYTTGFVKQDPVLPLGTGFWVKGGTGSAQRDIYFAGEVVAAKTNELPAGLNLSGNSLLANWDLATIDWTTVDGSTTGFNPIMADTIYTYVDGAYQGYFLDASGDIKKSDFGAVATLPIKPAQGLWYYTKGTSVSLEQ